MGYTLLGPALRRRRCSASGHGSQLLAVRARDALGVKLGLITTGLLQHGFEEGLDLASAARLRRDRAGLRRVPLEALCRSRRPCWPTPTRSPAGARPSTSAGLRSARSRSTARRSSPDPAEAAAYGERARRACGSPSGSASPPHAARRAARRAGPDDRTPCWVVTPFPP